MAHSLQLSYQLFFLNHSFAFSLIKPLCLEPPYDRKIERFTQLQCISSISVLGISLDIDSERANITITPNNLLNYIENFSTKPCMADSNKHKKRYRFLIEVAL